LLYSGLLSLLCNSEKRRQMPYVHPCLVLHACIRQTQCQRLPHEWGLGKGITEAKSYPRRNSAERRLRTQDLVTRRASTHQLHQARPSLHACIHNHEFWLVSTLPGPVIDQLRIKFSPSIIAYYICNDIKRHTSTCSLLLHSICYVCF
jgi:hypothetical protein